MYFAILCAIIIIQLFCHYVIMYLLLCDKTRNIVLRDRSSNWVQTGDIMFYVCSMKYSIRNIVQNVRNSNL